MTDTPPPPWPNPQEPEQPGAFQPGAQQPQQPGAFQPGAQQPGGFQPGAQQPGAQQPGAFQPGPPPGAYQPGPGQPGAYQPGPGQPGAYQGMPVSPAVQIERAVQARVMTDQPLISWPLYFFLLSWVTLGIYPYIVYYRRLKRAAEFRARKADYYDGVIGLTKQIAQSAGQAEALQAQIADLESYKNQMFAMELPDFDPGSGILFTIITFGIFGIILVARLMRFWWQIQLVEQTFDDKVSQIWGPLGVIGSPIIFQPDTDLDRSFWKSVLLTIVTFSIYEIIWDYHLHTDPDHVYPRFHVIEDFVVQVARSLGGGPAPTDAYPGGGASPYPGATPYPAASPYPGGANPYPGTPNPGSPPPYPGAPPPGSPPPYPGSPPPGASPPGAPPYPGNPDPG